MHAVGSFVPMASLHDAYELGGVAGHGRTTLVRLAVRRGDCLPVALKQLRMEHSVDPDKRQRFIRQYRRACMLQHDNIEALIDMVDGDDGPVAISEWVDGRSLLRLSRWRRKQKEAWDPSEIAVIARSLLEALRYAHHHPTDFTEPGMLHGGIWPGNVLVGVDGSIKLVDFGMATVWQEGNEPWQDLDAMRYLSADHMQHGPSAASDLYSVGAMVHELISGQRFRGDCETEVEMRAVIDRAEPPPPPEREIPPELERLRQALLGPIPHPQLALEHLLELCASIPASGGERRLGQLVREALRTDSTQPDPESTPPRGIAIEAVPQARERPPTRERPVAHEQPAVRDLARARERPAAGEPHAAGLGLRLERIPLGQQLRQSRSSDTQSVPVRVRHEVTAAREPLFLRQTEPPKSERTRIAEVRRSGVAVAIEPPVDHDADTVPLEETRAKLEAELGAKDEAPDAAEPEVPFDPDVTAEVTKIPQLPEDLARSRAEAAAAAAVEAEAETPQSGGRSWIRGPMGWALLGAIAVGIGLPLIARCGV